MSFLYDALVYSKNSTNVIQYSVPSNARHHYPSVVRTSHGLFCTFTHYDTASVDLSPSEIWGCSLYENGLPSCDTYKIIDVRAGKNGTVCPCIYQKSDGTILCLTLERNDDATYYGQIYQYILTYTGGKWVADAGTKIYESSDYQTNDYIWIPSQNILVTSTGRLIISIMTSRTTDYYTSTMNTIVRHLYSDNEGGAWSLSATVLSAAASGNEALISSGRMIQMSDDTIVEIFRTRSRYARVTKSTDNGATWSNAPTKSATLIESNADVELFCRNDILYAFVSRPDAAVPQLASETTRVYLDLWQSVDGGDTFTLVKNLLFKSGYIFTEPIIYDKGSGILMFYSYYPTGTTSQDLRFERYTYADLL
jgi:hypothetical protein